MFSSRRGRRGRFAPLPLLLIFLVLLAGAVGIGGWRWLSTSLPQTEGEIKVLGLSQPVTIARDANGIPTIRAQSEPDAYFALGYAHAQDRLWQMDLQRRIASGRLSEIAGKAGLANDRFFRVLGLEARVKSSYELLSDATKQALAAYAAGVNARIAAFDFWRQPPLEFILAGVRPKPWQPTDSLLWPRVMALQLAGNWRDELLNLKLIQRLGPERARQLAPMHLSGIDGLSALTTLPLLAALPPMAAPHLASNVWAVGSEHSTTGAPLLANDPHLNFQTPIQWYLARLEAPGMTVQGGTVPGIPFVLLGQNRHLAWGFTSADADSMDLFVESLGDQDGQTYQTASGNQPFIRRSEIIAVKGEPDQRLEVRETVHGPVISDVLSSKEAPKGILLALAATALNPADKTPDAMHRMSQAGDVKSFLNALADFQAPSQYVAYAGADGQIGLRQVGLVPLRQGTASPDLPRAGADDNNGWKGFVPPDQLPALHNPAPGLVANANNRLAADDYPYHLASNWPDSLRALRLQDLLTAKPQHGPDDMGAYQMDSLSMAFVSLKPFLMTTELANPSARKIVAILRDWDGSMARDLIEPTLFSAWAEEIQRALFADDLRKLPEDHEDQPSPFDAWSTGLKPQVIEMALSEEGRWCDDESTKDRQESCQDILARALEEALRRLRREMGADMTQWRWGSAHKAKFPHGILERLPVKENWVAPSIETDGDGSSLNRGTFSFGSFRHVHGAGLRAVYDIGNLNLSRFMIATGQSGNPFSRHYDDLLDDWREGRYLHLTEGKEERNELVLWPVQSGK